MCQLKCTGSCKCDTPLLHLRMLFVPIVLIYSNPRRYCAFISSNFIQQHQYSIYKLVDVEYWWRPASLLKSINNRKWTIDARNTSETNTTTAFTREASHQSEKSRSGLFSALKRFKCLSVKQNHQSLGQLGEARERGVQSEKGLCGVMGSERGVLQMLTFTHAERNTFLRTLLLIKSLQRKGLTIHSFSSISSNVSNGRQGSV